ncbi:Thioredoxin [Flexibacter flexilis DSM 6793]|uniref:Thioredoxin n=1 Tax=Flexibacter flexilis DSM 6793 TaxID=927664 RepID=A0A1I1J4L1_9BACT|nr:thioredoxin family protein [Flexibacter flexilis]SFC42952.1 Thioredoxin [Flexibacter flexilis DSM 6793]
MIQETLRKGFVLGAGLLLSISSFAQKGIAFETGTFAQVLEKSKQTGKPIFMDAYTTWCGPCKAMARSVFTNDTVAAYYNKNFVCYKSDMEKGEGLDLAKKYEVRAYPNLLYISAEGNILHRVAGFRNASDFVKLGQTALNPDARFEAIKKQYEAASNEAAKASAYMLALADAALPYEKVSENYFNSITETEFTTPSNWEIIKNLEENLNSKVFQYFIKNRDKYASLYGKESVEKRINQVYLQALERTVERTPEAYDKLFAEYSALNLAKDKETDMTLIQLELVVLKHKQNWAKYDEVASNLVSKYISKNAYALNSIAWDAYEHISDAKVMAKAEQWAASSCKISPEYANLDTYACILFKNGKSALAKKTAQEAIAKGKKAGEDTAETEALLAKINDKLKVKK